MAVGTYSYTFRTADIKNADTEDRVSIRAAGTLGGTDVVRINRDFGRGETFSTSSHNFIEIGEVYDIGLGKSGGGDAWYPEWVQVHAHHTGTNYQCDVNDWFRQSPAQTKHYSCRAI